MTNLITSLKVNDTVTLNGRLFTVDAAPTTAKYCIMVGIKGKRGADMVLCWYPSGNGYPESGKFFSMSAMARQQTITSIKVN